MRSILAAFLTIAVSVTGLLVALDLGLVLGTPPAIEGQRQGSLASSGDVSLVHAFYDAANDFLSGESEWALTAVVSPSLIMHSETGESPGGDDALATHFTALQRQGDVRLKVVQLIGEDREFTALVEAHWPPQHASPEMGALSPPLWQTIDRFRVQDGMITDYWPGAIETRPLPPLPNVTLAAVPPDAVVSLARLEIGPEVTMRALAIPSPQLLFVETGIVTLPSPNAVSIARAGQARLDSRQSPQSADDVLLGPGDAVLVPANSGQTVVNHGDEPAAILSLLIAPRDALYGSRHHHSLDMLVAAALHDPARIDTRTVWATDVASETLTIGALTEGTIADSAVILTGRLLVVGPGKQANLPSSSRLTFAIVTSGIMNAQSATAAGSVVATPSSGQDSGAPDFRLLRAGDALAIEPGDQRLLENAGATRLDLAIIEFDVETVEPSPSPTCRPSDQTAPDC